MLSKVVFMGGNRRRRPTSLSELDAVTPVRDGLASAAVMVPLFGGIVFKFVFCLRSNVQDHLAMKKLGLGK